MWWWRKNERYAGILGKTMISESLHSVLICFHLDSPKEPALALAGTCRSWRQIILNLWNNIFLDFRGPEPVKLLEFAKLWISHSENTLISIRNSSSRWTEKSLIAENVDPITYLVAPYVTRHREVDLRFLESSIDEFFIYPSRGLHRTPRSALS
jgi:hypothetical protein